VSILHLSNALYAFRALKIAEPVGQAVFEGSNESSCIIESHLAEAMGFSLKIDFSSVKSLGIDRVVILVRFRLYPYVFTSIIVPSPIWS